ncbi:MAG: TonB-dependent receptor plug domain-containing protein [Myxococcales bacterium]
MRPALTFAALALSGALATSSAALAEEVLTPAPASASDSPTPPAADGPTDTTDLESLLDESVVSGASHGAQTANTAPATTSTITAEELKRFGIRTLDEALDFLSLGMVTEHPTSAVEMNSRGVLLAHDYGNHVLLVVDGHSMNEPWDGTAYFDRSAALPIELIDHIEVILGPGSVLYGSNAMLGVVNVVTKRAKDAKGLHLVLESDLPYSLRGAAGGGIAFDLLGTPAELTAQVDYYGFKGPELTLGPQPYGADGVTGEPKKWGPEGPYGTWGGTVKQGWYAQIPSAHVRLVAGGLQILARGAFSKRAAPGGWGNFDDANNYELDRWFSLDLRYARTVTSLLSLSAHGYFDYYTYTQNAPAAAPESCLEGQSAGCTYVLDGHGRWGGVDLAASFNWLDSGRLVTNLGVGGVLRYVSQHEQYVDAATGESPVIPGDLHRLEGSFLAWLEQTARISSLAEREPGPALRLGPARQRRPLLAARGGGGHSVDGRGDQGHLLRRLPHAGGLRALLQRPAGLPGLARAAAGGGAVGGAGGRAAAGDAAPAAGALLQLVDQHDRRGLRHGGGDRRGPVARRAQPGRDLRLALPERLEDGELRPEPGAGRDPHAAVPLGHQPHRRQGLAPQRRRLRGGARGRGARLRQRAHLLRLRRALPVGGPGGALCLRAAGHRLRGGGRARPGAFCRGDPPRALRALPLRPGPELPADHHLGHLRPSALLHRPAARAV